MPRSAAASPRRPGATTAKPETQGDGPIAKTGVEEAAEARRAAGKVDPTKLKQAAFVPGEGWICPAKPEQITAEPEPEAAADSADADA